MAGTSTSDGHIELSETTEALIDSLRTKFNKDRPLEGEEYSVSEAVTFLGFAYEKMRNAVEFHEEHLIRRYAISRILQRRLADNPSGEGEGEALAKELLWGKYTPAEEISKQDVVVFQKIIDSYIQLYISMTKTQSIKGIDGLRDVVFDLMSAELEESISPEQSNKRSVELYYFYQVLVNKIDLESTPDELRDTYFYVAAEQALAKNDRAYIMYHLFKLRFGELHTLSKADIDYIAKSFGKYLQDTEEILQNPFADRLKKFAEKQAAPFRILYEILEKNLDSAEALLSSEKALKKAVEEECEAKYNQTGTKLRNAAIRSITYIFLTKMIFVLVFEGPLTHLLYGEIELIPIAINTIFPPFLMAAIVSFINPPSSRNTERIYRRIVDILDRDPHFETKSVKLSVNPREKRPVLIAAFSVLYLLVFVLVFGGLYAVLDILHFNIISKGIFVFFVSVVTFFAYRIRQTSKEFVLDHENNIFVTFATFLFLPILYLGKLLSQTVSKINIFIIFFDYLIEAPFKFLIEIIEEWSRFLKARKDELV